jgi:hypothetical protein
VNGGQEHGVAAGTLIGLHVQRDRLVDDRADAVADIATQAEEVQAGFVVDQYRDAHLGLVDVGQLVIERLGRASLDAGNVLAHFARNVACREIGRSCRHRVFRLGQFEGVVGAVADAQAATDAGAEKSSSGRAGRAQGQRRQGFRLFGIKPQTKAQHADAACHLG